MVRLSLLMLILLVGCMDAGKYASRGDSEAVNLPKSADTHDESASRSTMTTANTRGADGEKTGEKTLESTRKIIYTANVELIVEDFSNTPAELRQMVEKHGGLIAGSNIYAQSGNQQSGNWRIRVPVANFEAFLEDVRTLGELVNINTDSEEVTDQYYDLETRIGNKAVERDRLKGILADEKQAGKLKDVLDVEKRLAEVQGDIELAEGQMRRLKDRIAMTTVQLSIRQIRDYVPPEAAGFGTLARRSFEQSWLALQRTGQGLALGAIALAPWLPLILLGIFLLRFGWKRLWRRPT
jgi:hypothetical protein